MPVKSVFFLFCFVFVFFSVMETKQLIELQQLNMVSQWLLIVQPIVLENIHCNVRRERRIVDTLPSQGKTPGIQKWTSVRDETIYTAIKKKKTGTLVETEVQTLSRSYVLRTAYRMWGGIEMETMVVIPDNGLYAQWQRTKMTLMCDCSNKLQVKWMNNLSFYG